MEFTVIFLLATAIYIVFGIAKIIADKKQSKVDLKDGLILLGHIQKLVLACQKHRGLSNAVLQGNQELRQQLVAEQRTIETLITQGDQIGFDNFAQWLSFKDHWPRLKNHALSRDIPSQNLVRQHNVMIEGHLSLMDEIIRYHSLHTIMLDPVTRLAGICLDTLRVAETVGQTRAVGVGACAVGECIGVDRISLNFLRISLMTSTRTLFEELNAIQNVELHNEFQSATTTVQQSVKQLLDAIDHAVLIEGKTQMDSNEYFKIASKPIEDLFSVFNILLNYGQKTA
jgi:hypothetical protein